MVETFAHPLQWLAEAVELATAQEFEETIEDVVVGAVLVAKDVRAYVVALVEANLFMQCVLALRTSSGYDAIHTALYKPVNLLRTSAAKQRLRALWRDKPGFLEQALDTLLRIVDEIGVTQLRRSRVLISGQGQVGKTSLSLGSEVAVSTSSIGQCEASILSRWRVSKPALATLKKPTAGSSLTKNP